MAEALPATPRTTDSAARASTLELFFDLVFVFTITQVALILEDDPSWPSVAQAAMELLVIYWMYAGFAWLTNSLGTTTPRQRVVLLLGMAAFLVVSLSVPRAFGADGVPFGFAYLALTVVHLVGFLTGGVASVRHAIARVAGTNLLGSGLVIAAGYAGSPAHWPLWGAAVAVQWLGPTVTGAARNWELDAAHFGERHGLMIIIVLGESLVSVALAAQELPVTFSLGAGVLCGLAASAAMWWCYFAGEDERATVAFARRARERRGPGPLFSYDLPHVLMMAGVVGVAAGSRLSLPELTAETSLAAASLIAGGAAGYLGALSLFRLGLGVEDPVSRAVAALVALATVPLGTRFGAAQQLAGVAVVIGVMLLAEHVRGGGEGPGSRAHAEPA